MISDPFLLLIRYIYTCLTKYIIPGPVSISRCWTIPVTSSLWTLFFSKLFDLDLLWILNINILTGQMVIIVWYFYMFSCFVWKLLRMATIAFMNNKEFILFTIIGGSCKFAYGLFNLDFIPVCPQVWSFNRYLWNGLLCRPWACWIPCCPTPQVQVPCWNPAQSDQGGCYEVVPGQVWGCHPQQGSG